MQINDDDDDAARAAQDEAFELLDSYDADLFALALDTLGWKIVPKEPDCRKWPLHAHHSDCPEWADNGEGPPEWQLHWSYGWLHRRRASESALERWADNRRRNEWDGKLATYKSVVDP
jgi:hypothetical protein